MNKAIQGIFFFALLLLLICTCQTNNTILTKAYKSQEDQLNKSAIELVKNYDAIKNILTNNLLDGTIFLNKVIVGNLSKSVNLQYTNSLFENINSIYIEAPNVVVYEISLGNGMYNWDALYLIYNPEFLDFNEFLDQRTEALKRITKIDNTKWYKAEVLKNVD